MTALDPPTPAGAPRWRPWHGRPRTRDLLCLAGITLSMLYALAMIPLTPGLIATRPVLLELLSGSTSSVVAAGAFAAIESKLQLTVVVAAALPGLVKFDLLFWWAGVLWGHRIVQLLARHSQQAARFAERAERRGARFAGAAVLLSAFLPVPTPLVYAAAGWAGLRLIPFVLFDLIGSAAWAAFLATLGYLLGASGVAAADLVSRYALVTMLVLAAAAIAPHGWHVLRARRAARARARARSASAPAAGQKPRHLVAPRSPAAQTLVHDRDGLRRRPRRRTSARRGQPEPQRRGHRRADAASRLSGWLRQTVASAEQGEYRLAAEEVFASPSRCTSRLTR